MRRPADLALYLLDELLDALRSCVGLFLLDADQRCLVFLVGEPEIERAICDQRDPNQDDEQQRVFAHQAASRPRAGNSLRSRGWRHWWQSIVHTTHAIVLLAGLQGNDRIVIAGEVPFRRLIRSPCWPARSAQAALSDRAPLPSSG